MGAAIGVVVGGMWAAAGTANADQLFSWTPHAASISALSPAPGASHQNGLTTVACPTAGYCAAIGQYVDSDGTTRDFLATLSSGHWTMASPPTSGLSPSATSAPVDLTGVSCTAAGSCVAVGSYADTDGTDGLIETDDDGTWTASTAPTEDPGTVLQKVSCTSDGACTAVGTYSAGGGAIGLIDSESGGTWTAATAPALTSISPSPSTSAGTEPLRAFTALSCASSTWCVASANYTDAEGGNWTAFYQLLDTTWSVFGAGDGPLSPSSDPSASLDVDQLACPAATSCDAIGESSVGPVVETVGDGGASTAVADLTGLSPTQGGPAYLSVLSCPSSGVCFAGGTYEDGSDQYHGLVDQISGSSQTAIAAPAAPAGSLASPSVGIGSISCPSGDSCAATEYGTSAPEGALVTLENGSWTTIALPTAGLDPAPATGSSAGSGLSDVTCPAEGVCVAVGNYYSGADNAVPLAESMAPIAMTLPSQVLPDAQIGQPYSGSLVPVSGLAPFHFAVTAGSLPTGLTLDAASGAVTGTPTTLGTKLFSVTVTDSTSPTPEHATASYSLDVTRRLLAAAFPLRAGQGEKVTSGLGVFGYALASAESPLPAPSFAVTIGWGDGTSGHGSVRSLGTLHGYALYSVKPAAAHTYTSLTSPPFGHALRLSVTGPGGLSATATSDVEVFYPHPSASFVVNPTDPSFGGVSLFVPDGEQPGQLAITRYDWTFLDDYAPVVDDASMRPHYDSVIAGLLKSPGDDTFRQQAIGLGILPKDADGVFPTTPPLGSSEVLEIAKLWKAYFPDHVVPHFFDAGTGHVGVQLVVTDTSGTEHYQQENIAVESGCHAWGGPFAAWFGDYTTCDTQTGLALVTQTARPPDYYVFGIPAVSEDLDPIGVSGAVALVVTRGISTDAPNSVFLEVSLSAGAGLTIGPYAGEGWVGLPGSAKAPSVTDVSDFVQNLTVDVGLGFLKTTTLIYSPGGKTGWQTGVERTYGLSASAAIGASCSAPLPATQALLSGLASLVKDFSHSSSHSDPAAAVGSILLGDIGTGPDVALAVAQDLLTCG